MTWLARPLQFCDMQFGFTLLGVPHQCRWVSATWQWVEKKHLKFSILMKMRLSVLMKPSQTVKWLVPQYSSARVLSQHKDEVNHGDCIGATKAAGKGAANPSCYSKRADKLGKGCKGQTTDGRAEEQNCSRSETKDEKKERKIGRVVCTNLE